MTAEALRILSETARELEVVRNDLLEYTDWRSANLHKLDQALTKVEPFQCLRSGWLFTGDGGGRVLAGLCAAWAIDQLLLRNSPQDVLANAQSELAENVSYLS